MTQRYSMMGNAVTVNVIKAIASQIISKSEETPTQENKT